MKSFSETQLLGSIALLLASVSATTSKETFDYTPSPEAIEYEKQMPDFVPVFDAIHPDFRDDYKAFMDSAGEDNDGHIDWNNTHFIVSIMDDKDEVKRNQSFPINAVEMEKFIENRTEWDKYNAGHPDNVCDPHTD